MATWINGSVEASRLLESTLTESQRATFYLGWFEVYGSLGGHYRIYVNSTVQNIQEPGFSGSTEFCVTLRDAAYRQDVWLAQKILIEADERRFLRTAIAYRRGFTH